jgi:hypothetical protein
MLLFLVAVGAGLDPANSNFVSFPTNLDWLVTMHIIEDRKQIDE